MPRKAPAHAFRKGNPGGPGRPKGSKSVLPVVRDIMGGVIQRNLKDVETSYQQNVTARKTVVVALAEYARVNKETGPGSEAASVQLRRNTQS
jgi:hypothetical protein